nr:nuclear poly(A) polymerase 4-like isoform X1 [Tanacetum cinerariifolium]
EDSSNASPQKKDEEEAAVKKKYGVANPISFAGPTETDVHRNALLVFENYLSPQILSAEEIAKREEILRRLDQYSRKGNGIRPGYMV